MNNVLVKNGLVVTSHGIYRWDIKILNGIIAEVGTGLSSSGVEEVVDAAGCYVFPGVVDEHVHM
ncbi:MAG: allantoinase, partial [Desulfurococcaceae archaeon]